MSAYSAQITWSRDDQVTFSGGKIPDAAGHDALHRLAHHECFIANSVRTETLCRPSLRVV